MKNLMTTLFALSAVFGSISAHSLETAPNFQFQSKQQRIFEGLINDTIIGIVANVAEHDPIRVESKEGNIFGHSFLLDNLHIEKFSNIYASHIKLSGIFTYTFELVLEAPYFIGTVKRWMIDGDKLFGDGDVNFEVNGSSVWITAKINPLGRLSVSNIRVEPQIGKAEVSVTGLFHNEELSKKVSAIINHFLNDFVNSKECHDLLSKIAQTIIDGILKF